MDQREVNFYNGTVDNLKSIAKSLKRIADFCDRMEGLIKEEDQERPKEIREVPDDVIDFRTLQEAKEFRDDILKECKQYGEVAIAHLYRLRFPEKRLDEIMDFVTIDRYNRVGWKALGEGDIKIYPTSDYTYRLAFYKPIVDLN